MSKAPQYRKTSALWKFFTPIDDKIASCDACFSKVSYKSTTTNLRKHITNKHPHVCIPPTIKSAHKLSKMEEEILPDNHVEIVSRDEVIELSHIEMENENSSSEIVVEEITGNAQDYSASLNSDNAEQESDNLSVNSPLENNKKRQILDCESKYERKNNESIKNQSLNTSTSLNNQISVDRKRKLFREEEIGNAKLKLNERNKTFNNQQEIVNHRQERKNSQLSFSVTEDSYDYFGKYIASLLREMGPPSAISLQAEIISKVLSRVKY